MSWESVAAIAAVVGLFLTAGSMQAQAEATRLTNLNTVRSKIQDIQLHFGEILSLPENDVTQKDTRRTRIKIWDEVFFNEIEWLCVLYLEALVPKEITLEHLSRPLLEYWKIFKSSAPLNIQADPEIYSRFKRVIRIIQAQRQVGPEPRSTGSARAATIGTPQQTTRQPLDLFA
jgi:hypothetical protein